MFTRKARLLLVALCAVLVPLAGSPAAVAEPAPVQVRTLYYDASGAAEFQDAVDKAAQIWNDSVSNVRLVKGEPATITVLADDGWPRAQVERLGAGTIWMGREAVNEGHDTLRIAAHELGHILGLPDRRTGVCAELMSGHSAGTECTNPQPNDAEIAEVEGNFAGNYRAEDFAGYFTEQPQ